MDKAAAKTFLESLLNRHLRVYTTDERLFWGEFKCIDPDSNLVLQHTYEYRHPPTAQRRAEAAGASSVASSSSSVKMDMLHRYLGLVVVPGEHIARIETDDYVSQLKT